MSANRSTLNVLRIPVFALVLAFLLRKDTKRLYFEHLVCTRHYQSLDLLRDLATVVLTPIPTPGRMLEGLLPLAGLAYFVLAEKKVYKLPLKRLVGLTIAFVFLSLLANWVTGYSAGIVYRLTS